MKLRALADTISTYLTLFSALLLPLVLLAWVRSYLVSDRVSRANDGWAIVAGCSNGELSFWAAPTEPHIRAYNYRSREATWGWNSRRTFQRLGAREKFSVLGFAYAQAEVMPWRGLPLTGRATAVVLPLWFLNLLAGIMPLRLLARNMQSSKEFLAQREAKEAG
ncbi:MAG: hypothetical protein WBD40_19425 [Tepidisphaeraceae bacterium]